MKNLIDYNCQTLRQWEVLLTSLDPRVYSAPLAVLNGSSPGDHTRHTIEFYQCLLANVGKGAQFSYDKRVRSHALATQLPLAQGALRHLQAELADLHADCVMEMEALVGLDLSARMTTTLQRELYHLVDHAVHHLAIVRVALQAAYPAMEWDPAAGVAISTQAHQAEPAAKPLPYVHA